MKLQPTQIKKSKRWQIEKWDSKKYRWIKCLGTGTFATKSNAVVGMNRYKSKHDNDRTAQAAHDIMASKRFCAGVKL